MQRRVEAFLGSLPVKPKRLCVGLSGGLDSVVLLHLLAGLRERLGFALRAVHVHHGLSPNADAWADFARSCAARLGVACAVSRVQVECGAGLGIEAAARRARYAVFEQQDCDALLLAQHRDDQAETLLLNLLRGSGVRGLAAMPSCRLLASGIWLVRPLLDVARSGLLAHATLHGLSWVEDESNADLALGRNFLRHSIMPVLEKEFPGAADTFARSARHLAEADALLGEVARHDLGICLAERGSFCFENARQLSEVRLRNALREWLRQAGIVADSRAFDELLRMMREAAQDAAPVWLWRDRAVRRYRDCLHVTAASLCPGPDWSFSWRCEAVTPVPHWQGRLVWTQSGDEAGIAEEALSGRLELRRRRGGEGLRLAAGGPTRKLKHLYQEASVPPWLRDATPLLWINERLAAVPGLWVASEFAQAGGWQIDWQSGPGA